MNVATPDFVVFDRKLLEERDYWVGKLAGVGEAGTLRTDRPRPATYLSATDSIEVNITGEFYQRLSQITGNSPFLLYTILTAALKICLQKYTGSSTIVVGSPARRATDNSTTAANVLAITAEVDPQLSFRQFLLSVRETLLAAYRNQRYPFARLLNDLGLEGVENRCPLFDVALSLREIHGELPPLKNDITFTFSREPERISGRAVFSTALFGRESIERLSEHFLNLLRAAVEQPDAPISQLELMTADERRRLLSEWNDTAADFPDATCIHKLFEAHAAAAPDALALVFDGEALTYGELNRRSNQLAHHLRDLGVGPETLVGVCFSRSAEMVVAILGTLKAGGAYLPLDPSYPQERLAFMLTDARVEVLLTQEPLLAALPEHDATVVCLDTSWELISRESDENPESAVRADNLVYVIYTSGSTGRPKGVMIEHRGLCNLAEAQIRAFGIQSDCRILQFSSLSFDASIFEIVMALRSGATLYVERLENLLPGTAFLNLLRDNEITNVTLPPSVLANMPLAELPSLRTVVVAGEACSSDLVERWARGRRFFNAYGPTETTVWATVAECFAGGGEPSIGRPISNTQVYLLDGRMLPVPGGVTGELHIGGAGLARGYLYRPDLTAERFVPDPFGGAAGARLYKSGDAARYRADGEIEFAGRIDKQVKVRGYRIELGEIEAVLKQHEKVRDAVVEAREDVPGNRRLVAYVICDEAGVTTSELRAYVQEKLPEHMVPSVYVELAEMPLTPNGKIDRRALPAPEHERPALEVGYEAPRNEIEESIAAIWADLLGVERIGINDNFFELGGHSLLATQAISRTCEHFHIELPLARLFDDPTIRSLAVAVGEALKEASDKSILQIERIDRSHMPTLAESIDQLPSEQVEALLKNLLEGKGAEL